MTDNESDERRLAETAYHEVGHAVASYVLHVPFRRVSIIPDEERGSLGHMRQSEWNEATRPDIACKSYHQTRRMECSIQILYAGPFAGEMFTGGAFNEVGAGSDIDQIANMLGYMTADPEEAAAIDTLMNIRARQLLRRPENWAAVKALAEALLERKELSARSAREVIRRAIIEWAADRLATAARQRKTTRSTAMTGS